MHFVKVKTILSPKNGMNLYRGCTHGCIYCDSRSDCYGMTHRFEDIEVKSNAHELLRDALSRKRKPCMIGMGSMCDPYMPIEAELCHTRRALEIINEHRFGATLITKSDLVLRDLDLLKSINETAKAVVQITLTTTDDALARKIEPSAPSPSRRIAALRALRDSGIPTVVWMTPILPFITDTEENVRAILDASFEAGVKGIVAFGMGVTLRSGSRENFYDGLDSAFPGLSETYIRTYSNAYNCESPASPELMHLFRRECRAHGVMYDPDKIFEYLSDLPEKYEQLSLF